MWAMLHGAAVVLQPCYIGLPRQYQDCAFDNKGGGMTATFDDLKIAPELARGARDTGWRAPAGLQTDATPVIRRGNNAVLHASAGSGAVGAYGLGILDRLFRAEVEPGDPSALVLVPDSHAAAAVALSLARLARHAGLRVRALGRGWTFGPTHVLVAAVEGALAAVRASDLKLQHTVALVIDGADLIVGTSQWPEVETLMDAVPGEAQRVLVTGRFDDAIDRFVEGHLRKAMTIPPRDEPGEPSTEGAGVRYAVVSEAEKPAAAVHLISELDADQVALVCRSPNRAELVVSELHARGAMDPESASPRVVVLPRDEADRRSVQAGVISYDVPLDSAELEALHRQGGAVLVTPRERAHLLRIAGRARLSAQAVPIPTDPEPRVEAFREEIREAARGDLTPELAVLEPLLAEIPAAVVAAAAIRLTRTAVPASGEATQSPAAGPAARAGSAGSAPPPDAGAWVRLFLGIGSRDAAGPGDILGAITGEAGVGGDQVGKIEIRESHSTVEVASGVAARVIQALNGRSLRGRSLRVDYDRKGRGDRSERAGRGPGSGPSGGARRRGRQPGDRRP
jgi:ATP-dependent RNA helicase DeaD